MHGSLSLHRFSHHWFLGYFGLNLNGPSPTIKNSCLNPYSSAHDVILKLRSLPEVEVQMAKVGPYGQAIGSYIGSRF